MAEAQNHDVLFRVALEIRRQLLCELSRRGGGYAVALLATRGLVLHGGWRSFSEISNFPRPATRYSRLLT